MTPTSAVPQVSGDENPDDACAMPNSRPMMPSPRSAWPTTSQGLVSRSALSSFGSTKNAASSEMSDTTGTSTYATRQSTPASTPPRNEKMTAPTPLTAMNTPSAPGSPPLPVAKSFT